MTATTSPTTTKIKTASAYFAGGCFWCLETVFEELRGVESVESGYAGGNVTAPTYELVSKINFDPAVISYETLLEIFFAMHDPTTLNRQGPDVGEQYRSIVFYASPAQQAVATSYLQKLKNDQLFAKPIVTELVPLQFFYPAEEYHQNYYRNNPNQSYCRLVINPKVAKLRKKYSQLLKEK